MKSKTILTICVFLLICITANTQKLSLADMQNLCNKTNWEPVNQYLLNKGWEYYDSEKGSATNYNTITWSYNRSYGDKAEAWLHLLTFEGYPSKIVYIVFNKTSYALIQNSLGSNGYKLTDSEIKDNEIVSHYSSNSHILQISTEKIKKETYSITEESLTVYRTILIKKSGIYDPDNGRKVDYWSDEGNVKTEYTLKDGKLHGKFTAYYYNGNIEQIGSYYYGKKHGDFKEYDEEGNLIYDYYRKSDLIDGVFKIYYKNGQLKQTLNYLKGIKTGDVKEYLENGSLLAAYKLINNKLNGYYQEYHYNDEGELFLIYKAEYSDDVINGESGFYAINDKGERLIDYFTYVDGEKHGAFQKASGDSLIFGSYKNGKLHGKYSVYLDILKMLAGGIIRTDSSLLTLIVKGNYYNGLKSSTWEYYDVSGSLILKGDFSSNKKTGIWSYYYTNYVDDNASPLPYSGELYLTETYKDGFKNGHSKRYSSLKYIDYLCDTSMYNVNPIDTCQKLVYEKIYESIYYKSDVLHGPCLVKDSAGTIIYKGTFVNGEKEGEWLESRYMNPTFSEPYYLTEKGNYKNGKRTGKWKEYIKEDFIWTISEYLEGKLNGKAISYHKNGIIDEIKVFNNDYLISLIIYDSTGESINITYDILKETDTYLKVKKTEYFIDGIYSLEYWMKKDEPALNHNFFEFFFNLYTADTSSSSWAYPDGELKMMDKHGNIIALGNKFKDEKIGLWKINYHDQNIQIRVEYSFNKPGVEKYFLIDSGELFNGVFTFKDEKNELIEQRKIKNGLRNGICQTYDLNENKIKKVKYKNGITKR